MKTQTVQELIDAMLSKCAEAGESPASTRFDVIGGGQHYEVEACITVRSIGRGSQGALICLDVKPR